MTEDLLSKKLLVAYVGLDPMPFESGRTVHRRSVISRKGDPRLRARLFMSAFGGVRGKNPLREYYLRLVSLGKKKKLLLLLVLERYLFGLGLSLKMRPNLILLCILLLLVVKERLYEISLRYHF